MKNKALVITKNVINVSANKFSEESMIAKHDMHGILPSCRKAVLLTDMPIANGFAVRPLFGNGNGRATVSPTVWAALVENAEIVSDDLFPVELTPKIRTWARAKAMAYATCEAVTNLKDVAQSYLDSQRFDEVSWPKTCTCQNNDDYCPACLQEITANLA